MIGPDYGGSAQGIRQHYDAPDRFWALMLGPTMTYSSALFEPGDTLEDGQRRKLQWHLHEVNAHGRLLDIGCGWGSLLEAASHTETVTQAIGLTLSETQFAHVRRRALPRVEVRLLNWSRYEPDRPLDAIVSIGAFEHFAKPRDSLEAKRGVYRDFFERCRLWLVPGGRMTLQTMAFGTMKREDASEFMNHVVFPESDLPSLPDIVESVRGVFEIVQMRNDRLHYARTYDTWARNLRDHRKAAIEVVGEERMRTFERYVKMASMGFALGKTSLLRFVLRPIVSNWRVSSAP